MTRDVVSAPSLDECSFECGHAEAYCETFSYNEATSLDNCVLSALKAADIIMNQGRLLFPSSISKAITYYESYTESVKRVLGFELMKCSATRLKLAIRQNISARKS